VSEVLDNVIAYHQRTKHQPHAMARGPASLDWANQPNPFRSYEGSIQIALERQGFSDLEDNFSRPYPLNMKNLSKLFFESLAISGQKRSYGSKWSLRVNPSSGNLHPTEGYLIAGPMIGLEGSPGVYHYAPKSHSLEFLASITLESYQSFGLPEESLLMALTSIYWRESWKYGERAFRYCMIDLGHALAAVATAAACLGWQTALLDDAGTDDLARLIGIDNESSSKGDRSEDEHLDVLLAIYADGRMHQIEQDLVRMELQPQSFRPNILSSEHVPWAGIEKVNEATKKPPTRDVYAGSSTFGELESTKFCRHLRKRRSAQRMDKETFMPLESFHAILEAILPGRVPFCLPPWRPYIHPVIFVHRVEGLDRGLYVLLRDISQKERLQASMLDDFVWKKPSRTPDDLGFYLLAQGDGRLAIKEASCHQDIASDGCFAAALIAEFMEPLQRYGPWFYSRLYWECGLIGQAFYLASENVGFQGCGIGCFFDDMVHRMLGLSGLKYQDLYNFTVGKALLDPRIVDLSAYD
jgi:SagB-type dehydrogenase family enzyme